MLSNKHKSMLTNNKMIIGLVLVIFVLFLVLVYLYYPTIVSTFANVTGDVKGQIKGLDVILFVSPDCPLCPKQLDDLKNAGLLDSLTVKDIKNDADKQEALKYGVMGFPFFISRKNNTAVMGIETDFKKLVSDLQVPASILPNQQMKQNAQPQKKTDDTIYVLTREGCGFCTKAKADIAASPNKDMFTIIEAASPEAKALVSKFNIKVQGVPVFINGSDGKFVTGFKPSGDILKEFGK